MTQTADADLGAELDGLAKQIGVSLKALLGFMERVDQSRYRRLYRSLYNQDASAKEYDRLVPIEDRLHRLVVRLEDEGRYTDGDICSLALERLLDARRLTHQEKNNGR